MMDIAYIKPNSNGMMTGGKSCIPYRIEAVDVGQEPERNDHESKQRLYLPKEASTLQVSADQRIGEANLRARKIECRLLFSKYTIPQADVRCTEIHGTTFDGRYVSGRHICYWSFA